MPRHLLSSREPLFLPLDFFDFTAWLRFAARSAKQKLRERTRIAELAEANARKARRLEALIKQPHQWTTLHNVQRLQQARAFRTMSLSCVTITAPPTTRPSIEKNLRVY